MAEATDKVPGNFEQLAKELKSAEEALTALEKILERFDRSVIIEFFNATKSARLQLATTNHEFGGFEKHPEPFIPPGGNDTFASKNKEPTAGTEGSATYIAPGISDLLIGWDNPILGDNEANGHIRGPHEGRYHLVATPGAGNKSARFRYILFEKPGPYSLRQFLPTGFKLEAGKGILRSLKVTSLRSFMKV